jgi:hypothetical protein
MRHRHPRRNAAPTRASTLADDLDALAARVALLEEEGEHFDRYDLIRPILKRHLGYALGPSADWINPTWSLGGGLYLFEGDYDDYDVVSRMPADDPDEPDVIEEVERLVDLDALRRYFRKREQARRNPARKARSGAGREYLIDGEHATFEDLLRDNQDDEDFIQALLALDVGDRMAWGPGYSDERMTGWGQATFEIERIPAASERHNPSRKTPPPQHTFALEASAVQQGLFAPSSYEAKQKEKPRPVVDERQVDLFAAPPPKKNPRAAENGRYHYVMSCPGSTYEDIQALQESEQPVSRATFAKAIGPQAWRDIQANLGYDRDFSITKDWHVGYYKGVFRGVPCYFLRHSHIEYIYTLDGKLGPSLAADEHDEGDDE